jgi:hypothetical protein
LAAGAALGRRRIGGIDMASKENIRARQIWEELLTALTPADHEPTPDARRLRELGDDELSNAARGPH